MSKPFYDENALILDKYRNVTTPKYISTQINDIIRKRKEFEKNGTPYLEGGESDFAQAYAHRNDFVEEADFFPFDHESYYELVFYDMNEYQQKWYLHWRYKFLNNEILDTDQSYIFMFARELLDYSFSQNAALNLSLLEKLRDAYGDLYQTEYCGVNFKELLTEWLEDMRCEVGLPRQTYNFADFLNAFSRLTDIITQTDTDHTSSPVTYDADTDYCAHFLCGNLYPDYGSYLESAQTITQYRQAFNHLLPWIIAANYDNLAPILRQFQDIPIEKRRPYVRLYMWLQHADIKVLKQHEYDQCRTDLDEYITEPIRLCKDITESSNLFIGDMWDYLSNISELDLSEYELDDEATARMLKIYYASYHPKEN